ncbi:uncharacterized protein C8Q71DRAFT_766019 [Rhodofomes roseus]|uniref:BTB domain-containing protein n=1 Tax=Rhodofomes roseus TaxID=34475 RepID=A0ABQ8KCY9_9APHY|nr:uncharacterized protein C8Q71DRAFT_766019 [Rhodofomes roseus]KAH9835470.1 hypothetical protein C8Q71DRAFT_766019 [Rhodofomes roseus]
MVEQSVTSRNRLDSEEREQKPPIHDEEFWFTDGSAVVVAGDVAFRVYEGLLTRDSSVFRDLFGARRRSASAERIDGCVVVRLPDVAEEVRVLLRALLSPWLYYQTMSFSVVESLIRLGHKYRIQHITVNALERLKSHYSDDMETWLKAWRSMYEPGKPCQPADAIAAVNLARLTGTLSVLPSALYECSILPTRVLLQGAQHGDAGTATARLSLEDVERCLDARRLLSQDYLLSALRVMVPETSADCEDMQCAASLEVVLKTFRSGDHQESVLCRYDTLTHRSPLELIRPEPLCGPCQEMLEERHRREQQKTWSRLPEYFGIDVPGWSTRRHSSQETVNASDSETALVC